jgi:hypothetical protein
MTTVIVAQQFSRHPAGRTPKDGPFSGALFRERFLVPSLERKEKVVVEFGGTRGAGSSFLEEAFGGLVRLGYPKKLVLDLVDIHHPSNPSVREEVRQYIARAQPALS